MNQLPSMMLVTSFPQLLNIDFPCIKCGIRQLPNIYEDVAISNKCICCYNDCSCRNMLLLQCCCFGPSKIFGQPRLSFSIPNLLTVKCLGCNCGVRNIPTLRSESLLSSNCLCFRSECNLCNSWIDDIQLLCLLMKFKSDDEKYVPKDQWDLVLAEIKALHEVNDENSILKRG
mmetsp:Transcript_11747/g.17790  ORF Transcript_11747/g.17790 Transcript_11747/m.17790 type:complete len:173 (-) Transcript_11747:73-591(-)